MNVVDPSRKLCARAFVKRASVLSHSALLKVTVVPAMDWPGPSRSNALLGPGIRPIRGQTDSSWGPRSPFETRVYCFTVGFQSLAIRERIVNNYMQYAGKKKVTHAQQYLQSLWLGNTTHSRGIAVPSIACSVRRYHASASARQRFWSMDRKVLVPAIEQSPHEATSIEGKAPAKASGNLGGFRPFSLEVF